MGIAVDSSGNVYISGDTWSSNFPTTAGAFQTTFAGGLTDAFVTKLNATGSALLFSTFLGGSAGHDFARRVALDASGNAYLAGGTASSNFPTTAGAFQTSYGGGKSDAFVTKLNAAGTSLLYSTFIGGTRLEQGLAVALDSSSNVYVAGRTESANFPTTAGAFQTSYGGVADVFVTKLNATGSASLYSTYLGGTREEPLGMAADTFGNAYVTGHTWSPNFPVTFGAFQTIFLGGPNDAFATKLNPAGSALVYSTYLGGRGTEQGSAITTDTTGNAYVAGGSGSTDFPTVNPLQANFGGGSDATVTVLNPDGSALLFSTYIGTPDNDGASDI